MASVATKPIRDLLATLGRDASPEILQRHAYTGLSEAQRNALTAAGRPPYRGKVRDVVPGKRDGELLIVHSDRLSAFDCMIGLVPYKGSILTAISAHWLTAAGRVVPTHFLEWPHERVLTVRRTEPVKAEVVVRGYMAGSMMRAYAAGERVFCGVTLPDDLKPYGKLPRPIITPTTKAAAFEHDENATPDDLFAAGVVTPKEWATIEAMSLALFDMGTVMAAAHGWILADTKYEFGRDARGELRLIDEIHTPDSSRFLLADSYEARLGAGQAPAMLDKENVRRYLLDRGFSGRGEVPPVPAAELLKLADTYLTIAEALTGEPLLTQGADQVVDLDALESVTPK